MVSGEWFTGQAHLEGHSNLLLLALGGTGVGDGKVPAAEHLPGEGESLTDYRSLHHLVLLGHPVGRGEVCAVRVGGERCVQ